VAGSEEERAAVVTGGGTGIGLACAAGLLERDFAVLICGRRQGVVDAAVEALSGPGRTIVGISADMGTRRDPERVVAACVERFGRIDALVNNAGIYSEVPFLEMTAEAWDEMLSVNLRGAMLASVAAARRMKEQGGGRIVHVSSINGLTAEPSFAHYSAAKAGLISLAQSMAVDLGRFGIRTNAVAPGWVRTPMTEEFLAGSTSETLMRVNPLARYAVPEEIANVVVYLCTEAPDYLNGQTICVDGTQTSMAPMP
jgi:NAD(P)-dependent dehydrogenase (short-subunit alcohol dehydrogenase family)